MNDFTALLERNGQEIDIKQGVNYRETLENVGKFVQLILSKIVASPNRFVITDLLTRDGKGYWLGMEAISGEPEVLAFGRYNDSEVLLGATDLAKKHWGVSDCTFTGHIDDDKVPSGNKLDMKKLKKQAIWTLSHTLGTKKGETYGSRLEAAKALVNGHILDGGIFGLLIDCQSEYEVGKAEICLLPTKTKINPKDKTFTINSNYEFLFGAPKDGATVLKLAVAYGVEARWICYLLKELAKEYTFLTPYVDGTIVVDSNHGVVNIQFRGAKFVGEYKYNAGWKVVFDDGRMDSMNEFDIEMGHSAMATDAILYYTQELVNDTVKQVYKEIEEAMK